MGPSCVCGKWCVRVVRVALSMLGVSFGRAGPSCLAAGPGPSHPVCAYRDMALSQGALGHRELFCLLWASKWLFSSLVALRWEFLLRLLAMVLSSVVCENGH